MINMKTLLMIAALGLLITSCKKKDPEPTVTTPVTAVGEAYAGGTVFYMEEGGQHGLVISGDLTAAKWSLNTSQTASTGTGIGSGSQNTQNIVVAVGSGNYAAKICSDYTGGGYSDWYLPSSDELWQAGQSVGGMTANGYWSSSQATETDKAWRLIGATGNRIIEVKTATNGVRAIRRF
jgi:hypothetical protein